MRHAENVVIRRENYRPPNYWIDTVALDFDLAPTLTRVTSTLSFRRNSDCGGESAEMLLLGEHLTLVSITLDGKTLTNSDYALSKTSLSIAALPARGTLTVITSFDPSANLALEGLYVTNGTFCTQCEAEGFRRITYFPDRPDVLAEFTVTMRADKTAFPVLLSNGNLVSQRDLADGKHEAVWQDPHRKPSYLFALVAGKIDKITDHFTTISGRKVLLEIYSTTANLPRCGWAMECLKASMKWDEEAYGREYDLNRFMIYAADDFNMGAMENKGLNIFNSRFLLADKDTATDSDYQLIDAIVAHEYFHNWSGNRVTCRDWFQLSLKEGFTVFREQQYSAYRGSPDVVRIEEAAFMQSRQFAQDAGPMAHAIRPDEYEAIDNFYTVTVYEKGAEVIRMLRTLLGADTYRKGCDAYFAKHDGTAATCDDFVAAMESVSGRDLSQFKRWYSQAGTPVIKASETYDAAAKRYALTLEQLIPATPKQPIKQPMVIPVSVALVNAEKTYSSKVLTLTEQSQTFVFDNVASKPIPSLLREFSAPVKIEFGYSNTDLATLVANDTDGVVRWQSLRTLFFRAFDDMYAGRTMTQSTAFVALANAMKSLLTDTRTDPALIAHMLTLPSHAELADHVTVIDPTLLANARHDVLAALVAMHRETIHARYNTERAALSGRAYSNTAADVAHRALSGSLLMLANYNADAVAQHAALAQWKAADNATDVVATLNALRDQPCAARDTIYAAYHNHWQNDLAMLNRWFMLESSATRSAAAQHVKSLLKHPKFDAKNPNRVRAVITGFSDQNWRGFHAKDDSGYEFIADQILYFDAQNPSLAARFCDVFLRWHKCESNARALQKISLERIATHASLSTNVRELIEKTLRAGA
jgi:aminopeptidase N